MATFVRQTAVPCTLAELKKGSWIQQPDTPSGVQTPRGLLSRVNLLGTIVETRESAFVLDDGTTTLHVRTFDPNPPPLAAGIGDLVVVIGKPREYNDERYVVLEICKKLGNKQWIEYRRKELEFFEKTEPPTTSIVVETTPKTVEVAKTEQNPFEVVLEKIKELDDGQGVDVQALMEAVEHEEKEKLVQTLIEEGEIFEIKPGKVKVLE